jgi:hypothetical protein
MIKRGVNADGLQPEILLAIIEAREIYRDLNAELIITSLLDGKHMPGSFHYKGLAVDLRTRHLTKTDRALVAARLRVALGPEYDVVLEKTHMHVEYDPKE